LNIVWIVDAAYLMKAAPDSFDYLRLKNVLEREAGESFVESYYLNSTPSPLTDQQNAFHTWLKTAPPRGPKMRVKLYKLKTLHNKCPKCGHGFDRDVQKGVDVGIATLIIKLATQNVYDRLILSAGDGDFEDAIAYVKEELHKEFWLSGFEDSVSADLQSYANEVIWLDQFREDIRKT
jgi:nijmegen breakage syndrome protein 1